jgi:diacylglycerol kinase family enzyme
MPEIGIIANPHAKSNKLNPAKLEHMKRIYEGRAEVTITNDLDHLKETLRGFSHRKVRYLGISGGDGTISQTLTALINAWGGGPLPKVILFRDGTVNVLCSNLGIVGSMEPRYLEQLAAGKLQEIKVPTLKVANHYGFIYGDGFVTRVLEDFYLNKRGGLPHIAKLGLTLTVGGLYGSKYFMRTFEMRDCKIVFDDGEPVPIQTMGGMVATINKMPFGLPFFGPRLTHETHLSAALITATPQKLLWNLPQIMLNRRQGTHENKLNAVCRKLLIKSPHPLSYTIDGELFKADSNDLLVQLGPELEFIKY